MQTSGALGVSHAGHVVPDQRVLEKSQQQQQQQQRAMSQTQDTSVNSLHKPVHSSRALVSASAAPAAFQVDASGSAFDLKALLQLPENGSSSNNDSGYLGNVSSTHPYNASTTFPSSDATVAFANTNATRSRRRSSVSLAGRSKSSRVRPYPLRVASGSILSVTSSSGHVSRSSSSHQHGNNTDSVYTSSDASCPQAGAYEATTDLPASTVAVPPWNVPAHYVHSRSSSISSVSSGYSSNHSATSSSWSDLNHSQSLNQSEAFPSGPSAHGEFAYFNPNLVDNSYTSLPANSQPATYSVDNSSLTMSDMSTSLRLIDGNPPSAHNPLRHHEQGLSVEASARLTLTHPHQVLVGGGASTSSLNPISFMNAQHSQQQAFQAILQPFSSVSHAVPPSKQAGPVDLVKLAEGVRKSAGSANTTEKAKINFVHAWLRQNFILHPEGNISRHALYNSYVHICQDYNLPPINSASYGKAVRSFWPGIKTRRLGVRGASRYHYCGVRASNEHMRQIIDYYNSFDADGKAITCELPENSASGSDHYDGADDGSEEYHNQNSSMSSDHLIDQTGGLQGLSNRDDTSSNGSHHSQSYNNNRGNYTSVPLLPPGMADIKQERSGSVSLSSGGGISRPSSVVSNNNAYTASPIIQFHETPPEVTGPFGAGRLQASNSLRHQSSSSSSLHEQMLHQQDTPHVTFADLKTPTAFQFLQGSPNASISGSVSSRQVPGPSYAPNFSVTTNLQGYALGRSPDTHKNLLDPQSSGGMQRSLSPLGLAARSMSLGGAPSSSPSGALGDTFADRLRGRRATLPDLHITIPPPRSGPASSASRITSVNTSAQSIREEREESMSGGDEDENEAHGGVHTARMIATSSHSLLQVTSLAASACTNPLDLPKFDEIVQKFNAKLAGSSSHPSSRSNTPIGNVETMSANAVIIARNRSAALLRSLDMAGAEAVWTLYKDSHCKGLLRLARQGRLEEFESAVLLFWTQLDSSQRDVVKHPIMNDAIYQADAMLYRALLAELCKRILLIDVNSGERTAISVNLQQLMHIANHLEDWTTTSLEGFPQTFTDCRLELASRSAHLLARLAGAAQLAQALSGILHQPGSIGSIIEAWQTLNFDMITNQVALVTHCPQDTLSIFLDHFEEVLQRTEEDLATSPSNASGISRFIVFVDQSLCRFAEASTPSSAASTRLQYYDKHRAGSAGLGQKARIARLDERPLLLKWSYLSGQILRDLTIGSSPAFGAYQILSLFLEEYLAFVILRNMTLNIESITASVQAAYESSPLPASSNASPYGDTESSSNITKEAQNVDMAFLVSPQSAERPLAHGSLPSATSRNSQKQLDQNESATGSELSTSSSPSDHFVIPLGSASGFHFPPVQPASAFSSSFPFGSAFSPNSRSLFGEKAIDKWDFSSSGSVLPPPTPSAFSSFPRSPGLSRYFPSLSAAIPTSPQRPSTAQFDSSNGMQM